MSTLAPGQSITVNGTLVTDQDDVTAGETVNTATATGTSQVGDVVQDQATVTVPLFDWDALDNLWSGGTWNDFDAFWSGQTWNDFDTDPSQGGI